MTDEFFGELTDEELDEVIGGSKDMKLFCEAWRRHLNEEEDFDSFLDQAFNKIAKLFGQKLEDEGEEIEQELEQEKQLDEGAMLGLGLLLAAPAIVNLFTGIAKVFGHTIEGWTGKDLGVDATADKITHYAHKAHKIFQVPIEIFVRKVLRIEDTEKVKQATGILFNLFIAFLMVYSGVGAGVAAAQGKSSLAGLEASLSAIKGNEVLSFLKTNLKRAATTTLEEVYSEKQRKWACAQIDNPTSLTKAQAKEMCSGPTKK